MLRVWPCLALALWQYLRHLSRAVGSSECVRFRDHTATVRAARLDKVLSLYTVTWSFSKLEAQRDLNHKKQALSLLRKVQTRERVPRDENIS